VNLIEKKGATEGEKGKRHIDERTALPIQRGRARGRTEGTRRGKLRNLWTTAQEALYLTPRVDALAGQTQEKSQKAHHFGRYRSYHDGDLPRCQTSCHNRRVGRLGETGQSTAQMATGTIPVGTNSSNARPERSKKKELREEKSRESPYKRMERDGPPRVMNFFRKTVSDACRRKESPKKGEE